MTTDRRTLLKYGLASMTAQAAAMAARPQSAHAGPGDEPIEIEPNPGYLRIECEEAWTTAEIAEAQVAWADGPAAAEQPYVASMARSFASNAVFYTAWRS